MTTFRNVLLLNEFEEGERILPETGLIVTVALTETGPTFHAVETLQFLMSCNASVNVTLERVMEPESLVFIAACTASEYRSLLQETMVMIDSYFSTDVVTIERRPPRTYVLPRCLRCHADIDDLQLNKFTRELTATEGNFRVSVTCPACHDLLGIAEHQTNSKETVN